MSFLRVLNLEDLINHRSDPGNRFVYKGPSSVKTVVSTPLRLSPEPEPQSPDLGGEDRCFVDVRGLGKFESTRCAWSHGSCVDLEFVVLGSPLSTKRSVVSPVFRGRREEGLCSCVPVQTVAPSDYPGSSGRNESTVHLRVGILRVRPHTPDEIGDLFSLVL